MSAGCLVIGSRTAPVEELIEHERNGLLVDFFAPAELAETIATALADRRGFASLRQQARETILQDYSVTACLPRQLSIIAEMTGSTSQANGPTAAAHTATRSTVARSGWLAASA
jgi:glycosyltransferase involved in cell wall biosynthesis